jgi:hypothetical protein
MKKHFRIIMSLFVGIFLVYALGRALLCIYIDYTLEKHIPNSSVPIDVVLIATKKDFEVVPYTVKSIRKYLKQPINRIVLISNESDKALKLAKSLDIEFIDENSLLKLKDFTSWIKKNHLSSNYPNLNWYYQQFLKLLYYKISKSEYYFVIDADIVMNRPFVLVSDNKVNTFYIGQNSAHKISESSTKKLLGEEQHFPEFSYIADLMCFNKNIVKTMLDKIEQKFNIPFYEAAMLIEQNSDARFSEYEMYGAYANNDKERLKNSVSYLPSVYAPEGYLNNYLASNHYLSDSHTRKRTTLFWDRYDPTLKAYPYIAYHSWVPWFGKNK